MLAAGVSARTLDDAVCEIRFPFSKLPQGFPNRISPVDH
jgi:hypothetical protein